jgi:cysteinyl-tRNA synthetase
LPDELAPGNFGEALDDDLNVSAALGAIFELIRDSNRLVDAGRLTPGQALSLLTWREKFESVLAFSADEESVPDDVREVLARRAEARAKREWALSDALRDQLLVTGWQVKDTKEGQKLSRKASS